MARAEKMTHISLPITALSVAMLSGGFTAAAQTSNAKSPSAEPSSTSTSIPEDVTNKLGRDLTDLQQAIQTAAKQQTPTFAGPLQQVEVTGEQARVLEGASPSAS